ncbi:MAG TPA: phosphatase PAP2 family protein [Accumulibacter sp.]|nr:phosphatase PAP2 family protein [Accumulibacter sp.]HMW16595.1 phosphatase PAP2 family protein [Accumulibacter sp.]HNC17475.1 phosphatase PAP2 family protein [Accumulibacter sp.]HND79180.1 phosphatase PAP2 family protein [Accumulibacter sp.]HNE13473.1 phosphatase PAP2 family protein [Accumulibacter sp.]
MALDTMAEPVTTPLAWAWPDRARWTVFLRLYALLTLLFTAVYGGSNWIATHSGRDVTLHFAWELTIPLIPSAILIYFSIALLFWLPPFVCSIDGLRALGRRFALATLVAGLLFVAIPVRSGFARIPPEGAFHAVFSALWQVDGAFNSMPSLHIAYSTLVFCALSGRVAATHLRLLGGLWFLAICASVLLVHQHHLADIAGGLALAWAAGAIDRRWRPSNQVSVRP